MLASCFYNVVVTRVGSVFRHWVLEDSMEAPHTPGRAVCSAHTALPTKKRISARVHLPVEDNLGALASIGELFHLNLINLYNFTI